MSITNIAAYLFVRIDNPSEFLVLMKNRCDELNLKGTIILACEGINFCLAGADSSINAFLNYLKDEDIFENLFSGIEVKRSYSASVPFKKMVVRLARETITMRQDQISPLTGRAPSVNAKTLKRWLDQGCDDTGRQIVLLDTRDKFEVDIGTFRDAQTFDIQKFSQFPDAIKNLLNEQQELKDKTIVSFCTGGIRCEKAALYMQELNLPMVYQLEGGILKYFEEIGGDYWDGECFVFDDRIALNPQLEQTTKTYERIGGTTERKD